MDFPHIRGLFDELLKVLSLLQVNIFESSNSFGKKKLNKAFSSFPCGYINVEEVSSVALRLLRINSASSPKQVRADKKLYDDLMQVHLNDLHCLAWNILSYLFKNLEIGTEIFEKELSVLVRDQIKTDLKAGEFLGKGSERALAHFNQLIRSSYSFNGQVFVSEIIKSGIFTELSAKFSGLFCHILRSGLILDIETSNKKARIHQVSESDQKRLEMAQTVFSSKLLRTFSSLSQLFVVFESSYVNLSSKDHVVLAENIITSIVSLLQSQHNFKFVPEINEGLFLRDLVCSLSSALNSFQPAYLPPFLSFAMRIINLIASRSDGAGLIARRALLQVDLLIHPRRLGPVSYRTPTEAIIKVFERPEPFCEEIISSPFQNNKEEDVAILADEPIIANISDLKPEINTPYEILSHSSELPVPSQIEIDVVADSIVSDLPSPTKLPQPEVSIKRNFRETVNDEDDVDDDDLPFPQIIDSGPDEI